MLVYLHLYLYIFQCAGGLKWNRTIDLTNCVTRRVSYGGTSVPSVEAQITWVTQQLGE